ncbi:uncharacterized protein LOC126655861 [Mercurialis annua]|uniref:uncharacterized protein LOC126655861 n=1 Tax=Mercurialis annua TaxID=3986 RepID=UPI00215F3EB8|nr:uncharacterized protein LOC126655861 [Mercurialis annua]XP_050206159.1 uncharacterized protein LOC126655861 [Mercurialis annua]
MRKRKVVHDDNIIIDLDCSSGDSVVQPSKQRSRRKRIVKQPDKAKGKLNSTVFDFHFKYLWSNFPEEKRTIFTYFECIWFYYYMTASSNENVLTWIRDKHIFSKKYVIVPIVYWSHWNLLILCNFGESLDSVNETPCMLLLDSLQKAGPRRLEPAIRRFVLDIFRSEGRPESKKAISKIPLLVPKVPQQRNSVDCGNYVLYFINLFVNEAPPNFSMKDYPYFMKDDWFDLEGFAHFCEKLKPLEGV